MAILNGLVPGIFDFVTLRGDTLNQKFRFDWNDQNVDLDNATVTLPVVNKENTLLFTLSEGSGITVVSSDDDIFVEFTSTQTTSLDANTEYDYELKLDFGADGIKTVLKGAIRILQNIG